MDNTNGKNNEWDGAIPDGKVILDELTEVQKQQIMQYVYAAVPHYLKQEKARITQLEQINTMLQNALNVLLACLETGIPVKDGKVTLRPEDMQVLTRNEVIH